MNQRQKEDLTKLAKVAVVTFGTSATFGLAALLAMAANWLNPDLFPLAAAGSIVAGACGGLLKVAWDFYRERK